MHMGKDRPKNAKHRVYLVDDEVIVRAWLKDRIEEEDDLECAGEARNGDHAVDYLTGHPGSIDLVILDLAMPGRDGFEVLNDLTNCQPDARVLIYTQHRDPEFVRRCRRRCQGYMLKDEPVANIMPVIHLILSGESYYSPGLEAPEFNARSEGVLADFKIRLTKLTPSEREVVICTARGMTSRDAGKHLGKSHRTVEEQLRKIYRKLGVNNKAELAQFAVRSNLLA